MVESSKEITALNTGLLEEKAFLHLGHNTRESIVEKEGGGDYCSSLSIMYNRRSDTKEVCSMNESWLC